eukprot:4343079-Alexandrium_andersonii.AAC.1
MPRAGSPPVHDAHDSDGFRGRQLRAAPASHALHPRLGAHDGPQPLTAVPRLADEIAARRLQQCPSIVVLWATRRTQRQNPT